MSIRTRTSSSSSLSKVQFLILVAILALLLSVPGCATKTFQYGRVSSIGWYLTIEQKPGEKLRDVTLYVPFPREDGEPAAELLRTVKAETAMVYNREGKPRVAFVSIQTRFGKMLKVSISEMDAETGGVSIGDEFRYASVLPIGRPDKKYILEPLIARGQRERAPLYAEYQGGTGFYLWVRYDAVYADMYLPESSIKHFGTMWVIGKSMTPSTSGFPVPTTFEEDRILVGKRGWNEIPVWTLRGYVR